MKVRPQWDNSTCMFIATLVIISKTKKLCIISKTRKAECWRIDAFELWCWRRLLQVRWTPRRSNQSIVKEISPECSLEGLMPKLKLWYFGHLMQRADSVEKNPDAGKDWRIWVWASSGSRWWTGKPGALRFMGSQSVGHHWATEQQHKHGSNPSVHLQRNKIWFIHTVEYY